MAQNIKDAFIYGGRRSAFGNLAGPFVETRPDDLAGLVLKGVVESLTRPRIH